MNWCIWPDCHVCASSAYLRLYGEIFMIFPITLALLTSATNAVNLPAVYEGNGSSCIVAGDKEQQSKVTPLATQDVVASQSKWLGKCALKLELTAEEQARQLAGAGGNRPTLVILGKDFTNGVIEANVAATVNGLGGPGTRGFVGIAFHIADDLNKFEAVYLRMTNGTLNIPLPPAPRDVRAIQYVAHPDFHFEESRKVAPGQYEQAAAVAPGQWHKLRVEIENENLIAFVDGKAVLQINDLKYSSQSGQIGIWIGDGTSAYVSDFNVIKK